MSLKEHQRMCRVESQLGKQTSVFIKYGVVSFTLTGLTEQGLVL